MGIFTLLCAGAFILIYWITAWAFFKTLAIICVVITIVELVIILIKAIFS